MNACVKCERPADSAQNNVWCQRCYDHAKDTCKCGHRHQDHVFRGLGNGRCSESNAVGRTCDCVGYRLSELLTMREESRISQ